MFKKNKSYIFLQLFLVILLPYIASRCFFVENGQYYVRGFPQWIDLPIHISYVKHFIFTPVREWFAVHPLNASELFNYHFLIDLLSSILVSMGVPLRGALAVPVVLSIHFMIHNQYFYFREKGYSPRTVAISIYAFLLNGGSGLAFKILNNEHFLKTYASVNMYFVKGGQFVGCFPNVLSGMFFAQRGLPLGIGLMFYILRTRSVTSLLVANIILMLTQVHVSLILLGFYTVNYCLKRDNEILKHFLITLFTFLIIYFSLYHSPTTSGYLAFIPGISYGNGFFEWPSFWFASTFILIPVFIYASYKLRKDSFLFSINIFAFVVFCVANLIKTQPDMVANLKYIYIICPFVYLSITQAVLRINKFAVVVIALMLCSSGVFDIYEYLSSDLQRFEIYTENEKEIASEINRSFPRGTPVIIEDKHSHFISVLTHLQPILASRFIINSYGHKWKTTHEQIGEILLGDGDCDKLNNPLIVLYKGKPFGYKEDRVLWLRKMIVAPPQKKNFKKLRSKYQLWKESDKHIIFQCI